jgi:hypothetical protein
VPLLLLLLLGCKVRVGVLDKEAAELRDEVAALQQRLAAFDEAAVRDFAAKVDHNWFLVLPSMLGFCLQKQSCSAFCGMLAPSTSRTVRHCSLLFACNPTCATLSSQVCCLLTAHLQRHAFCMHCSVDMLAIMLLLLLQAESYKADLQRANSELTSLLRDKSKVRWMWHGIWIVTFEQLHHSAYVVGCAAAAPSSALW